MNSSNNFAEQQLPEIPVFICYRRTDAKWHAEWLFRNLNKRECLDKHGAPARLKVYYDLAAPAVDDWTRFHFPSLEQSKALIVICSPGIAKDLSKSKKPDWVYKELRWWCSHRSTAPIIVEAVADAERWIPDMIQKRWEKINRITLPRQEIEEASSEDRKQIIDRISNRILEGIGMSQQAIVYEDLQHLKRLNIRLRTTVAICAVALIAALVLLVALKRVSQKAMANAAVAIKYAKVAREYEGISLNGTAINALERDPSSAFVYAFAASRFTVSTEPMKTIQKAITNLPVWRRIIPPDTWEERLFFQPPEPCSSDAVAVDPNLSLLVCSANVREDKREAGKSPLYLYDLETGKMIATQAMASDAEFITPDPLTTRIFMTKAIDRGGIIMLHLLSKDNWSKTIHTIENAREVKTSGGDWPCYALTTNGTVLRCFPDPNTGQIVEAKVGSWEAAKQIVVHPSGKAIILLGDESLKWLDTSTEELREVSLLEQDRTSKHKPLQASFANGQEQFFVLTETAHTEAGERNQILMAIDLRVGTQCIITAAKASTLDSWKSSQGFEATPEGSRIVIKEMDANREGERVKIIDIRWPTVDSKEIKVTGSNYLDQGREATTVREVGTMSLAPNGEYLILASERYGTSGTTTTGGAVESWDLTPLGKQTSLRPVPAELRGIGVPVVRLAYSSDSSRLLAWDARGISHVFRVRTSAPPIFQQQVRIPEDYETRFFKPDVATWGKGRFVSVGFSPDDLRYFDLQTGQEHNLSKFSHEHRILDTVWHSPPLDQFTIATIQSLFFVSHGLEKARINFSSPADLACVREEVTAVALKNKIEVYQSKNCKIVSNIPITGALTWIWAESPEHNSIMVYAIIKSKFHTWEFFSPGSGKAMRLETKPPIDIPSEVGARLSWRVMHGCLVVVKHYMGRRSIQFFDLNSGEGTDKYKAPPGGWPSDLVSVSNLHVTSDGHMLFFFKTRSGQFYGRWDDSGLCSDWRKIPSGRIGWIDSTDDESVGSTVLIDEKDARLIALADGSIKAEFQMEFGNQMPPPPVAENNGSTIFSASEQYQSVVRRILLGGFSEPFPITNVGLPAKLESELKQLTKSFNKVIGNTHSSDQ